MKRLIAVLLVMGVIMTAFADDVGIEQIKLPDDRSYKKASSTTVSLTLSGSYGKVWFSKGSGTSAIPEYALTMQAPDQLVTNLHGNTGVDNTSPKVFAKSTTGVSDGLYLNWNIVSAVPVIVSLEIAEPMKRSVSEGVQLDVNDKIGWSVKSGGQTISVSVNNTETASNGGKVDVHTKDAVKYGEAASQIIEVETDNVWGKNNGKYTATLTAYIRIGG